MYYSILIVLSLIIFSETIISQTVFHKTKEYLKALEALQEKDTTSATTLFQESIREKGDTPSYYELAKIYWQKKDFLLRNKAFEYMKMAVMKDEKNIEYKYFYADICQYFARFESVNQWKKIVAIDSTQIQAWINLAEFSGKEFEEWDKSFKETEAGLMSIQKIANEDYFNALNYYNNALRIDSLNYKLCLSIGLFYARINKPELGILPLSRFEKSDKANKDTYLCLSLLYNKAKKIKESFETYRKALNLMSKEEKEDFTLNSIKFILETTNSNLNKLSEAELKVYIENYWETNDPVIMTDYNERLLEHYSRVAYANLCYSIPRMNIVGWKSNRGEIVLRYGEPLSRVRTRPQLEGAMGKDPEKMRFIPKAEIWNYENFTIKFSDVWMNENFPFDKSQLLFVDNLRLNTPVLFYPKFEGPIFDLPYQTYQFASKNKAQTDVYLTYGINFSDTNTAKEKFSDGYDIGLFMFDNNFNKKYENKKTVSLADQSSDVAVNTLEMSLTPQSGNLAFEMERKKDKGVAAYHGKFIVKNLGGNELKISDVVLASNIETEQNINGSIKRNSIYVLPNPTKNFSKNNQLYLYYEVYNLSNNKNNLTDFEQKITITKKEEDGVLNSLLSVVGLDKEGKKISLTSKYQTQEKDPQMYLQLDMTKYEPGEYAITVTIKDNVTGRETSNTTKINWQ